MISIEQIIAIGTLLILLVYVLSSRHDRKLVGARLDAVLTDRDKYRELAEASMTYLDALRIRLRIEHGEPDFEYVPRIPAIRHSDPTRIAEDHADVETLEARLASITEDINRLTQGGEV